MYGHLATWFAWGGHTGSPSPPHGDAASRDKKGTSRSNQLFCETGGKQLRRGFLSRPTVPSEPRNGLQGSGTSIDRLRTLSADCWGITFPQLKGSTPSPKRNYSATIGAQWVEIAGSLLLESPIPPRNQQWHTSEPKICSEMKSAAHRRAGALRIRRIAP